MDQTTPLTTVVGSTAQQAAELEAMRRMLDASRGTFSLSIAVCNSPALRDYLIGRLQETTPDIEIVSILESSSDPFGYVKSLLDRRKSQAVFITDIERVAPSDAKDYLALRSLNASRELWEQHFPCPVVFWIPEYAAALLSINARDFWRYRSHRFEFVSEFATAHAGVNDHGSGDLIAAANLTQDEKQFRIAELEQRLADIGESPDPVLMDGVVRWMNELAYLYLSLGNVDAAERQWDILEHFASKFKLETDLANAYGNLANIQYSRGDLEGAEALFRKALAIYEGLSEFPGMAGIYGNLGNLLRTRGDLDGAEAMHRKSLAIEENLGRLEGMASDYGNLGIVLRHRGDLNGAEAMYHKALTINKKLGRLEGVAIQSSNLGIILATRGDLDGAEILFRESLAIYQTLGHLAGIADVYGNLGNILKNRGNLKEAEGILRSALDINEKLGRLEGAAKDYDNLGTILKHQGNISGAREMWMKSRELFARLGMQQLVDRAQRLIEGLAISS